MTTPNQHYLEKELADLRSELADTQASERVWRRRAQEADQKLLRLAKLAYRRYSDGKTAHDSMSGGCDAYQSLYPYEGQEPPGKCTCGADTLNEIIDEILGDLKRGL